MRGIMNPALPRPINDRRRQPRYTEVITADWIDLIRAEYVEMPGLSLTEPQVERLWNLTSDIAETLLSELERAHFLRLTKKGTYVRADLGA
jgi:hypothetical protein